VRGNGFVVVGCSLKVRRDGLEEWRSEES
jgi:hypothetical protein